MSKKPSHAAKAPSRAAQNVNPDHPGVSDEQLARIGSFHKSQAGGALQDAETELDNGIAVASVLLEVLEATPGSEHEATVLRIAIERLEAAANHLDDGFSGAARASGNGARP